MGNPIEKQSIIRWRNAIIFALGTLISRGLGLVRDILMGWYVPDFARDTFLFAFRLPNTLRDLLGEGALNASFVPILSECEKKEGIEKLRIITNAILTIMTLLLLFISVIGVLIMPLVPYLLEGLRVLTQGTQKTEEQMRNTVLILQLTFPYLFWIGIAVFLMAPLFVIGNYKIPGIVPALLNIPWILSIFIPNFTNIDISLSLVIGVWVGGILQFVVLYIYVNKLIGRVKLTTNIKYPEVSKAFFLILPVILGQAAGEINKLVDSFFSYSLSEGTVSALFYANRLIQLPLAIFGTAISVSILPELTRYTVDNEKEKMKTALIEGLFQTWFMIIPTMVILSLLSEPVVRFLFQRGEFSPLLTQKTANAVVIYSIGIIGFSGVKVLVQGFYAMNLTTIPVIVSSFSMLLNVILNVITVRKLGYIGLVLSTTISFWVNFLLLYILLGKKIGTLFDKNFGIQLLKYITATLVVVISFFFVNLLFNHFEKEKSVILFIYISIMGGVSVIVYIVVGYLLKIRELSQIIRIIEIKAVKFMNF
ncbi:MAG: murein biosynthesis integral membrane protein MurJ [Candidatus Hydrogenedentes bacterium]|nr:murein biosynthesis integral membrane protein MurJ [Candidatus Hydrogenedentota bacterium]